MPALPPRTCVTPEGTFTVALHRPSFHVANRRQDDHLELLGRLADGAPVDNTVNFPAGDLSFAEAMPIYEIANPFPFRGATYIGKPWADRAAADPGRIRLPQPEPASFHDLLEQWFGQEPEEKRCQRLRDLPQPLLLALAATSSDPRDLAALAEMACGIIHDEAGNPIGLRYQRDDQGQARPVIHNAPLFETLVNNPALPDAYKVALVLRPGVQGTSPIVGDWRDGATHVFEYLRSNSYIPWGHYAANMAHDAVRYDVRELSLADMRGLRFLYYQRTFLRIAAELGLTLPGSSPTGVAAENSLEELRRKIVARLAAGRQPEFSATLWGWNYGFDYAPSGYRLHASHQQIHQQFALVPAEVTTTAGGKQPAYACGDLVADCCRAFAAAHGKPFFDCYLAAIRNNQRTDGRTDLPADLVVWQNAHVMLFVPKAQTSQWELQLVCTGSVANVVEADAACRDSLDQGIHTALSVLAKLGARMVTSIEFSGRLGKNTPADQRLLYSFLPKLPESMGAFSEAQLRFINGHYPEDFARACRAQLD